MKNRITNFFRPPVIQENNKKTHTAIFLNTILWTILIGSILAIPLIFTAPASARFTRLVAVAFLQLLTIGSIILMHRGNIRIASMIITLGLWMIINLEILLEGDGIHSSGFPGNIIVVLIAGILLGQWGSLGIASLCITTGMAFLLLNHYGLMISHPAQDSDLSTWIIYSIIMVMVAILLDLSMRNAEHALAKAHQEIDEREQMQEQLRSSEEKYRNYIEQSAEGIWLLAFDEPIPLNLPPEEQVPLLPPTT